MGVELASQDGPGTLLGGPWPLGTIGQLGELVDVVRHMPSSSVREWLRLIQLDTARALAHWQRMRDVLKEMNPKTAEELTSILEGIGVNPESGFGNRDSGEVWTPMLDALVAVGLGAAVEPEPNAVSGS